MKLLISFLIICSLSVQAEAKNHAKKVKDGDDIAPMVVNGNDASPHQWPWQISLRRFGRHICGGSLISDKWVITAAHCVQWYRSRPQYYKVIVGAHRRRGTTSVQKTFGVKWIKVHERYSRYAIRNDVALLLLDGKVDISSKVKPIKLPTQGSRATVGKTCYITGWGRLGGYKPLSDVLQEAPLTIASYRACRNRLGWRVHNVSMICAGAQGKGGCNGDSGGPLACKEVGQWILRGLTSWGRRGCSTSHHSVFARVSTFVEWINKTTAIEDNFNCSFERRVPCFNWNQDRTDDFDWTLRRGQTPSRKTGPSYDHTSGLGYYMYIETSWPRRPGQIARFISDPLPASKVNRTCLSFWYHMHGKDVNTLRVIIKKGVSNTTVWSRTGQRDDNWLEARVDLESTDKAEIVFEGVSGSGFRGDIAIDDISISDGACTLLNDNCNFDQHLCSWSHDSERVLWIRKKAAVTNQTSITGPSLDHTKGLGYYMYFYKALLRKGRLISNSFPATNHTCLSFWYHMYGREIETLRVLIKKGFSPETSVWSRNSPGGDKWLEGKVTIISRSSAFKVVFEGENKMRGRYGNIGIDDITFTNGPCNISESCRNQTCFNRGHPLCLNNTGSCYCPSGTAGRQCEIMSLNCSVEKDKDKEICPLWNQDKTDNFDWTRRRGQTPTLGTGPSSDHTTGNTNNSGYYMYIETSGRRTGDKARLISESFPATNHTCLSFWYHMYGGGINTLRVLLKRGAKNVTSVWSRKGQSGNRWVKANVDLSSSEKFQVICEGVRGNSEYGDIAIDDIVSTDGPCVISKSCRNQTCYNKGHPYCVNDTGHCYCQAGTYGKQCEYKSMSCSFDEGICVLWSQVHDNNATDQLDWTLKKGRTRSWGTGPTNDHTSGNGFYIYIDTYRRTSRRQRSSARLISDYLPATNRTCLSFWYHMYGYRIDTLRVLIKKGSNKTETIWSRTGQRGNRWLQAKVNISSDEEFQVLFEGFRRRHGYGGDIAIDDVSIKDEPCLITYSMNCTFDKDLCPLWSQEYTDNFDWIRRRGRTPTIGTGPSADHTTGNTGYYMYIETSHWRRRSGLKARLISKPLPATNHTCLSFWYHMYGIGINTLRVLITTRNGSMNGTNSIWSKTGQHGNRWYEGNVNISSTEQFQVVFEGVRGASEFGDIAIDDVVLENGPCEFIESCNQICYNKGNPYCVNNTGFCYCLPGTTGRQCEFKTMDCSFDRGICGLWNQDNTDNFDWTLHKGRTPSYATGPSSDHTTGNYSTGYYIYIETSPRRPGDSARLLSDPIPPTNNTCLSFWYHMYGRDINTLRVLIRKGASNAIFWSRRGNHGNRWIKALVNITSTQTFQIVFEGIRGYGYRGDIAIDDISVTNGSCNMSSLSSPRLEPCENSTSNCRNGGTPRCFNGTFQSCLCRSGYHGSYCQYWSRWTTSRPCFRGTNFCFNGGTPRCYNGRITGCHCRPGYYGRYCRYRNRWTTTRPCFHVTNVCYNGGTPRCNNGRILGCYCRPGYYGRYCRKNSRTSSSTSPSTPCSNSSSLTCYNGGTSSCVGGNQFCRCSIGFTGSQCQYKIMRCPPLTCYNGGTRECVTYERAACRCPRGITGRQCELVSSLPGSLKCYHCDTDDCRSGEKSCASGDNQCATITHGNSTSKSCATQTMCKSHCVLRANCKIDCCSSDLCNRSGAVKSSLMVVLAAIMVLSL